ncbi:hypothetical protein Tanf_06560 [Tannerella forsythia]|nr:hypothetical protein Tanf_06560 [Tannerella forsythia]OLQ20956.1 hypothetical protein BGK60_10010 [Tannerella forsythia]
MILVFRVPDISFTLRLRCGLRGASAYPGGVSVVLSIVLYFIVMYGKDINIFLIRCKYFVCFLDIFFVSGK